MRSALEGNITNISLLITLIAAADRAIAVVHQQRLFAAVAERR